MDDEISVTVIATGFDKRESYYPTPQNSSGVTAPRGQVITSNFNHSSSNTKNSDDNFYDIMSLFKNK